MFSYETSTVATEQASPLKKHYQTVYTGKLQQPVRPTNMPPLCTGIAAHAATQGSASASGTHCAADTQDIQTYPSQAVKTHPGQ